MRVTLWEQPHLDLIVPALLHNLHEYVNPYQVECDL